MLDKLGAMENFSVNSLSVFRTKYLRKDEKGEVCETPDECFRRVARAVSIVEENKELRKNWEEKFFKIMSSLEFMPGGRTLANAGTNYPQLANCFVLPMEDNVEEIFEVVKDSSILKKFGGGVGFSFSKIRPKNDLIAGTSGSACGPVALMKILDSASEIFMQDGKRRSGNMVVLSVNHPDVIDFITAKKEQRNLPQVNYSLGISDKFMKAVEKNKAWDFINPRTGRVSSTVKARSIFEVATAMAWESGDPGMIFLDRINKDNPTPSLGAIEAVNLCGEQPLLPYEACNLGSINLVKFLDESTSDGALRSPTEIFSGTKPARGRQKSAFVPQKFVGSPRAGNTERFINWSHLAEVIEVSVRFLDDVIDAGRYPLSKVDRMVKGNRKIGLGVMGWADLLVKLGIPYDSKEALDLAEKLMKFMTETAHRASQKLGKEKGNFPNFLGSVWQKKTRYMRNAACTTIAPTGSISMIAGVSSGIEPLFALSYYKEVFGGIRMPEVNQDLVSLLNKQSFSSNTKYKILNTKNIIEKIIKLGSVHDILEIPKPLKSIFITAHEISYPWHVKMQAAFQTYTDNAVSKTINLPNEATVEDVEQAFLLAWKLGCKGITIYRDKSRSEQVLNIGDGNSPNSLNPKDSCPKCGKKLIHEDGCVHCSECDFSACEI
ncbi:MAG: adenosylcobalamin-dependent ribonucleoside-diphosphate reductase [Candidatus Gottesmanbacteria bacterium]